MKSRLHSTLVLLALLFALPFAVWLVVAVVAGLRERQFQAAVLSAEDAPSDLLIGFISGLEEGDPDPRLVDKLAQKIIATDLTREMRSGSAPRWMDLMESLHSFDLLSREQWRSYVEKFLSEAQTSSQPEHALAHLLRYERKLWLERDQSIRLLSAALEARVVTSRSGIHEFVLDARRAGRVTDEDWSSMVRRSYPLSFVVRKQARLGTSLPVRFDFDVERTAVRKAYHFEGELEAFFVDGERVEGVESAGWPGDAFYKVRDGRKFFVPLLDASGNELSVGPHTIGVRLRFHVSPQEGKAFTPIDWVIEQQEAFAVVPKTSETVELVTGLSEKMNPRDFIEDPRVMVWKMTKRNGALFRFGCVYPSIAFSYDVYWKSHDEEVLLGSFFVRAATKPTRSSRQIVAWKDFPTNIDLAAVDVVLRPNRGLAEKQADCDHIWGDDIVLSDVPVSAMDPPEWYTRRIDE